jgi:hypothetical protein
MLTKNVDKNPKLAGNMRSSKKMSVRYSKQALSTASQGGSFDLKSFGRKLTRPAISSSLSIIFIARSKTDHRGNLILNPGSPVAGKKRAVISLPLD